jgi:carboxypeptidase Taq
MTATPYRQLEAAFRRAALIGEAGSILYWDRAVMMPDGAAPARAEQAVELQLVVHETLTRPEIAAWLEQAEFDNTLDEWQRANLHEMRRNHVHRTALSAELIAAMTKAASACEMAWRQAKPKGDFKAVLPLLSENLRLAVEAGQAKAAKLGTGVYDALLDGYEPDGRSAEIDAIFADLVGFLPGAIAAILERQKKPLAPKGPFPVERQRQLSLVLMRALGFPFERGRLDVSHHPFTGGATDDIRITTRYDEKDFAKALMATLHETGHAMYEAQLPRAWQRQPVGESRGMTLHESQSLLVEMQCCRSRDFLGFAAPHIRKALGGKGAAWSADNLYRLGIRVARGFIRVDADEVTYPCHVILRYRLERAMIAGDLKPADLPGAWNDGMKELLGVVPPNHTLGVLQDIHWYGGSFGYFPTYTLGALAAAQLFQAAERAVPRLKTNIAKGKFEPLFAWLATNVHGQGSRLSTRALLETATGAPLGTQAFKRHIRARYLA